MYQANVRWNDLGQQIQVAIDDIDRYKYLNHNLIYAIDKYQALRNKNKLLVEQLVKVKENSNGIIGRMRTEMKDLHL